MRALFLLPVLAASLIAQPCAAVTAQAAQRTQPRIWHAQFAQDARTTRAAEASAVDLQLDQAAASQPLGDLHLSDMPELAADIREGVPAFSKGKQVAMADMLHYSVQPAELAKQHPQHQPPQSGSEVRCSEKQLTEDGQVIWVDVACAKEAAEQLTEASDASTEEQPDPLELQEAYEKAHAASSGFQGRPLLPTPWTKDVNASAPWPQYPRPQLRREAWLNLNGIWEFECSGLGQELAPAQGRALAGKIVVPYPPESYLSGLSVPDGGAVHMLYRRTFSVPPAWAGQRTVLHFGGVDWQADVTVNNRSVGIHRGGYNKFSFDITDYLKPGDDSEQELLVEAYDPTDSARIPIGKQRLHPARKPSGIFYTASSGIWKTVWLEPVPEAHITEVHTRTDVAAGQVFFHISGSSAAASQPIEAVISSNGTGIASFRGYVDSPLQIELNGLQLWTPESPVLYDIEVSLLKHEQLQGSLQASASSAAAYEQLTIESGDAKGHAQLHAASDSSNPAASLRQPSLSRRRQLLAASAYTGPIWQKVAAQACALVPKACQLAVAAQQTAASQAAALASHLLGHSGPHGGKLDSATPSDSIRAEEEVVDKVKSYFGLREIGVGPVGPGGHPRPLLNGEFIFQIGMLDQGFFPDGLYTAPTEEAMVSDLHLAKKLGFNMLRKHIKVEPDLWYYHADRLGILVWQDMPSWFGVGAASPPTKSESDQFEMELTCIIQQHKPFPSIINYVVFNEGWGQYDTERVVKLAEAQDDTRLFDCASGWTDYPVGDFKDMHKYVGPGSPLPTGGRAAVLGEFGGLGLRVAGHRWIPEEDFSYEMQNSSLALATRYLGLIRGLGNLMVSNETALSAAVYTELSDVEAEINGFVTYDRRVLKVEPFVLHTAHETLIKLSRSLNAPQAQQWTLAAASEQAAAKVEALVWQSRPIPACVSCTMSWLVKT